MTGGSQTEQLLICSTKFENQQFVVNCVRHTYVQWKAQATQPVQWTIQIGCQVDGVVGGPWRVAPWESSHRSLRELHRLGKTQITIALLLQQCPVTNSLNVIKHVWAANVHTHNTVCTTIPNVIGYNYSSALLCSDCPPETNNYICTGNNILGKS